MCNEILFSKNFRHQFSNVMQILVADLHEAASALVQQCAREQQAVPQVVQIRMDPEIPGVAERADRLRFLGEVFVPSVRHVAPVHERLEVRAVTDAVGRVDVDGLNLPAEAFLFQQAVHDQEAVAGNQTVGPVVAVFVELDGLPDRWVLPRRLEQGRLGFPAVAVPHGLDGRAGIDSLVHVERDGRHLERRMLRLAGPDELRIEMRVVGVGRFRCYVSVRFRGHQTDARIVRPPLSEVLVAPDVFLACHAKRPSTCFFHRSPPGPGMYAERTPASSAVAISIRLRTICVLDRGPRTAWERRDWARSDDRPVLGERDQAARRGKISERLARNSNGISVTPASPPLSSKSSGINTFSLAMSSSTVSASVTSPGTSLLSATHTRASGSHSALTAR